MNRLLVCDGRRNGCGGREWADGQRPVAHRVRRERITRPIRTNTFGAFTFDDFSAVGAFTDGPNSMILDVQDSNGSNGVFGGVGVDYGTPPGTNNAQLRSDHVGVGCISSFCRTTQRPRSARRTSTTTVASPWRRTNTCSSSDLTTVPNDGQFHCLVRPRAASCFSQAGVQLRGRR